MGWWSRLKAWQKGAMLLGTAHLVIYCLGLIFFGKFYGYFVMYLEYPWAYLLVIFGKILNAQYHLLQYPGALTLFPYGLLIGTVFYVFIGSVCGWITGWVSKRN